MATTCHGLACAAQATDDPPVHAHFTLVGSK
jgi:hypothetical protein